MVLKFPDGLFKRADADQPGCVDNRILHCLQSELQKHGLEGVSKPVILNCVSYLTIAVLYTLWESHVAFVVTVVQAKSILCCLT
jgi:hypothetical protein